jgi:hypothetical protein
MQFQTRLLLRPRLCLFMILLALTFNGARARAEKLIYPNSSIEMYEEFSDTKSRQLGKELRLACTSVKDVPLPKLPTLQKQRLRSKNACSEAKNMYYDLLAERGNAAKSADWLKVHACAVAEQDHYVLMMVYANGYGVKPNLSVALKYACTTTWSASELAGRVQFFAEAISNGSNQTAGFDMCDHARSGMMDGVCASHEERQQGRVRAKKLTKFLHQLPNVQRPIFNALRVEVEKFAEATSSLETDLSGTARGMFVINAKEAVLQQWMADLESLESQKFLKTSQTTSTEMNTRMGILLSKIAVIKFREDLLTDESKAKLKLGQLEQQIGFTTISIADIPKVQKDWERYKTAWLTFAKERYKSLPLDDLEAELTSRRNTQLEKLLSMSE